MHFHDPLAFALTPAIAAYSDRSTGPESVVNAAVRELGFLSFDRLAAHVKSLPLARPTRDNDPVAVLREGRGTSSAKHRLLAIVAHGCGHYEVTLTMGIYAMTEANTPGVGSVLAAASLPSFPGARYYLTIDHERLDFTGGPRATASPLAALSAEYFLTPEAMPERKGPLQQQALENWASANGLSLARAWCIRQACQAALAGARSDPSEESR